MNVTTRTKGIVLSGYFLSKCSLVRPVLPRIVLDVREDKRERNKVIARIPFRVDLPIWLRRKFVKIANNLGDGHGSGKFRNDSED